MPEWLIIALGLCGAVGLGGLIREVAVRRWSKGDESDTQQAEVAKAQIIDSGLMRSELWAQLQRQQGRTDAVQSQIFIQMSENAKLALRILTLEQDTVACRDELQKFKEIVAKISPSTSG